MTFDVAKGVGPDAPEPLRAAARRHRQFLQRHARLRDAADDERRQALYQLHRHQQSIRARGAKAAEMRRIHRMERLGLGGRYAPSPSLDPANASSAAASPSSPNRRILGKRHRREPSDHESEREADDDLDDGTDTDGLELVAPERKDPLAAWTHEQSGPFSSPPFTHP